MLTLPNLLTLSRIAAIPIIVILIAVGGPATYCSAAFLFALAATTDYFDGKLARSRQQTSPLGRMFDPIADKLLVGAALIMLAGADRLGPFGIYAALIILLREIFVSGMREYLASEPVKSGLPVSKLAKWKATVQMVAISFLIGGQTGGEAIHMGWFPFAALGWVFLWIAALLTLITGWDYLRLTVRHITQTPSS